MLRAPITTGDELPDRYVSRRQAAEFLGLSCATLAGWGTEGVGPKFVKLSAGRSAAVRYSLAELQRYMRDPQGYSPRAVGRFNRPAKGRVPVKGSQPVPGKGPNVARSRRRRNRKAKAS